ncbi:unnamed protein product [Rotaria sp. Silwood1]|nr:unnamed protein product [Rotaria sp. Silwood1]
MAMSNPKALDDYSQAFDKLDVKLGSTRTQLADLQKLLDQQINTGGPMFKQAVNMFVSDITKERQTYKNPQMLSFLEDHFNTTVAQQCAEFLCEKKMDFNDMKLADNFSKLAEFVQKQICQIQK